MGVTGGRQARYWDKDRSIAVAKSPAELMAEGVPDALEQVVVAVVPPDGFPLAVVVAVPLPPLPVPVLVAVVPPLPTPEEVELVVEPELVEVAVDVAFALPTLEEAIPVPELPPGPALAEQLAVTPVLFVLKQSHDHEAPYGPNGRTPTALGEPTLHKPDVGVAVKRPPAEEPQTPLSARTGVSPKNAEKKKTATIKTTTLKSLFMSNIITNHHKKRNGDVHNRSTVKFSRNVSTFLIYCSHEYISKALAAVGVDDGRADLSRGI